MDNLRSKLGSEWTIWGPKWVQNGRVEFQNGFRMDKLRSKMGSEWTRRGPKWVQNGRVEVQNGFRMDELRSSDKWVGVSNWQIGVDSSNSKLTIMGPNLPWWDLHGSSSGTSWLSSGWKGKKIFQNKFWTKLSEEKVFGKNFWQTKIWGQKSWKKHF